jgi:hypothetical protein
MCRNIHVLFNFDPPATSEEINNASLQFVRKISGFNKPSQVNESAFEEAVKEVEAATQKLLKTLQTDAKPKNREEEHEKAHARAIKRFGV